MAVEIDNFIVIAGRCDPQRCRQFCSRRVSLEAQHNICEKFWARHQTMETRHEHLDKIVVSKQVARRRGPPACFNTYEYNLYPDEVKTVVSF